MRTVTTRTISGRCGADGSAAITGGGEYRVYKSATGSYMLTLVPGAGRPMGYSVLTTSQNNRIASAALTSSGLDIRIYNPASGGLSDDGFAFMVEVAA